MSRPIRIEVNIDFKTFEERSPDYCFLTAPQSSGWQSATSGQGDAIQYFSVFFSQYFQYFFSPRSFGWAKRCHSLNLGSLLRVCLVIWVVVVANLMDSFRGNLLKPGCCLHNCSYFSWRYRWTKGSSGNSPKAMERSLLVFALRRLTW